MIHELEIKVHGKTALEIEEQARLTGEEYFGGPVVLRSVESVGWAYEFGVGTPRAFEARVIIVPGLES